MGWNDDEAYAMDADSDLSDLGSLFRDDNSTTDLDWHNRLLARAEGPAIRDLDKRDDNTTQTPIIGPWMLITWGKLFSISTSYICYSTIQQCSYIARIYRSCASSAPLG
jgi:hypothetical protein